MIKKAWTTDDCPLEVGSVIHDNVKNKDVLVTARNLAHTDNEDNNRDVHLIMIHEVWFSGNDLLNRGNRFVYYPDWPDTSVTKPCYTCYYDEVVEEETEEDAGEGLSHQEFFNEVFKLLRDMSVTKGMYEESTLGKDTYAWDNKAHAIIQGHLSNMLQELEDYKENIDE